MSKLEFHLFRAKFIKSKQASLFYPDLSPSEIFIESIKEKPTYLMNNGHSWHIGNLELYNNTEGYFAVGRTTKSIVEKFDEENKNFKEEINEESPYTHIIFDSSIGIMGIAKKSKLSPTVDGIARKIEKLLKNTDTIKNHDVEVLIDYIRDPESFISHLQGSYSIKGFTATFGGPNPFDADLYFQKPMSVYLQNTNGKKGKTIISGEDLDADALEDVAISIASTGNNASAKIQDTMDDKTKTIYLGENQITISIDEEDFDKQKMIENMRNAYNQLREQ